MQTSDAIISVIRAEAPWQSLRTAGIYVYRQDDGWEVRANSIHPVQASPEDVATGLINLSFKSEELMEWASFLLSASSLISLDPLEQSAEGNELLEALWDASSGEPVDDGLLQRLKG